MFVVLRRAIWLLVVLPIGVLLIGFAVANRHPVQVILDPLSPESPMLAVDVPLFLLLLGSVITGLVLGGAATWFGQGRWRRTARRRSDEAAYLRREADRLTRQLETARQPQLPQSSPAD